MTQAMCMRCHRVVPVGEVEATPAGVMCLACKAASANDAEADAMVRSLAHSTGRKELVIGLVLIVLGIVLLAVGLSIGVVALLPLGIVGAGVFELVRGARRLSS